MLIQSMSKVISPIVRSTGRIFQSRNCHGVFGIQDLLRQEKPEHFAITALTSGDHEMAVEVLKKHYLNEHVLVRARGMNLSNDRAIEEYLISLLRQGNSLFAKTEDEQVAGICVSYASSPLDPKNLRNYAFYRQDPNTKDFLYFTAKLQETPNLWDLFKERKVYEVRMVTVKPEYRRQGLAVMLVQKSMAQAFDQGYKVVRMDCINPYDYKVAERCMMSCFTRFPLHKLRGANAPFIKKSSDHNCYVRVYVEARIQGDKPDRVRLKQRHDFDSLIE
ncbi:PREDICTED: uncharacterized protein LOC106121057 [Papilio xuthus]|uniref:Uncharacterized protein LOC106121057 n=1 Tax=Papilio xuthus TaxID=66420 RepID=A0AAJ6ZGG6_PAPXU|nr:PREDICTED: uncharacterized protein LOC106121057 [Papilio xuthus]